MHRDLFIGIDLGTTGIKAGLFDESGAPLAAAAREITLQTPAPGFTEFDPDDYVTRAFDCIRELAQAAGPDSPAIRAVGLSSQAQTFVLLDDAARVLRPAVSWLDVRAEREAEELSALSRRLGCGPVNAISSAPKILWLRRREPLVINRVRRVLLLPDFLIWRLTARAATDPVTASSTGAFDLRSRRWLAELLDACGLAPAMMPDVFAPGTAAGPLTPDAAAALGLSPETIAVVGTNDQCTGALGAGNVAPGCASLALGTALALIATSRSPGPAPPGVAVVPHPAADGHLYAVLAYAKTSGVVLRWLRDLLAPGLSYDALFAEIAAAPIGAAGVACLPHFSGSATPDFNPAVRGAFAGLNLAHGRSHLARALVESLAFTVRDNLDLIDRVVRVSELRAIGGGAKSDVWLQMIADVTAVPVTRPEVSEAACLGAAVLAMVGARRFSSVAAAAAAVYRPGPRFNPNPAVREPYRQAHARCRALFESLCHPAKEGTSDGQA